MPSENGWGEWSKYVLKELERLNECLDDTNKDIKKIYVDIAVLKVKAGVWGLLGGAVPVIFLIIYKMMKLN